MSTIGLALSGGGFRATLYHLGVIRYLRDSGSLPLIGDIAAVSGGSIVAAHLVLNWDRYNGTDAEFAEAAAREQQRAVREQEHATVTCCVTSCCNVQQDFFQFPICQNFCLSHDAISFKVNT
jgi:predicted acylesterase/phospholipase RssA